VFLLLQRTYFKAVCGVGTREEPGALTQGGALFSLVPLVWESNTNLPSVSWLLD
jgi:hypothetical protein